MSLWHLLITIAAAAERTALISGKPRLIHRKQPLTESPVVLGQVLLQLLDLWLVEYALSFLPDYPSSQFSSPRCYDHLDTYVMVADCRLFKLFNLLPQ